MDGPQSFFQRWSRRKLDAGKTNANEATSEQSLDRPSVEDAALAVDFDALDFNSNYQDFMLPQTPHAVRNKALRKLWASNAVFTEPDGLQDYAKDYTEAATRLSDATQSAYRVGRGFMTDEEVAAWAELAVVSTPAGPGCRREENAATDSKHGQAQLQPAVKRGPECRSSNASGSSASEIVQTSRPRGDCDQCRDADADAAGRSGDHSTPARGDEGDKARSPVLLCPPQDKE